MGPTVTFLMSIGLCLDWASQAQSETIPRPTLWAVPGPVVPKGADVTLRCQGQLGTERFQLGKDGEFLKEKTASWGLAEFVLRSLEDWRDAGSYSCRSGQGPRWSEPSEPLDLVVTGAFPAPCIGVLPVTSMPQGSTVTIWCQIPPQAPSENFSVALLEAKSLEPLQTQSPGGNWANFSHLSLRVEDSGNYRCIYFKKTSPYKGSHTSPGLNLTVHGRLPKPTLWARPGLVMAPGVNTTLWCSRPKLFTLEEVTFILWKAGTQKPLQHRTSADLWTSFLLPSVGPEDTGNYSCAYRERRSSGERSEPSDYLELVVTGSLPRPSLSALPGLVVEPGIHVTLQCRLPPRSSLWGVTFALLKVGCPHPLQTQRPVGTSADFLLLSVTAQDAGNYSCLYYGSMAPHQLSEISDVLEIWVTVPITGSTCSNSLIILLSCVSFVLLLCLPLMGFLCQGSIPMGFLQGESPRRCLCCPYLPWGTCLPHHPEAPREEVLSTEVAKARSRQPLVSVAEESQGVTYTELNINLWNERKTGHKQKPTEPIVYATVSRD